MSGVLVLSLSTLAVKVIGLAVKIPLLSILGAAGMGYFNSAYEIYAILCIISTAGLPTALSILVSANRERGDKYALGRIYSTAMGVFMTLGALGSIGMLLFARPISYAIGNPKAYYCMIAISPALFFVCVSSGIRGYFQGLGIMTPTAVSQMIEALGKLIFGVGFAAVAVYLFGDVSVAAASAVCGLVLGIIISSIYLLVLKIIKRDGCDSAKHGRQGAFLGGLLKIAFPITLSSAVISSCKIIDMSLLLRRLQSTGVSTEMANTVYGAYTTLAVPIFSLVPSLITPIALSLAPRLVGAVERGDGEGAVKLADRSVRLTVLLALPASMGLSLYSRDILELLFSGESEAIAIGAPLLSVLGVSVLFSGLITTTNSILQAYGHTVFPIVSMLCGAAIKAVTAYLLIGNEAVGAAGAPISTIACDIAVSALNLYAIGGVSVKERGYSSAQKIYLRPLFASLCAMTCSYAAYLLANSITEDGRASFVVALPTAILAYVAFAFIFKCVDTEDIECIPLLNKIFHRASGKNGVQKDGKNDY